MTVDSAALLGHAAGAKDVLDAVERVVVDEWFSGHQPSRRRW